MTRNRFRFLSRGTATMALTAFLGLSPRSLSSQNAVRDSTWTALILYNRTLVSSFAAAMRAVRSADSLLAIAAGKDVQSPSDSVGMWVARVVEPPLTDFRPYSRFVSDDILNAIVDDSLLLAARTHLVRSSSDIEAKNRLVLDYLSSFQDSGMSARLGWQGTTRDPRERTITRAQIAEDREFVRFVRDLRVILLDLARTAGSAAREGGALAAAFERAFGHRRHGGRGIHALL